VCACKIEHGMVRAVHIAQVDTGCTCDINVCTHSRAHTYTRMQPGQELDWLKEASLLDATADVTGNVSGLGLGDDDDDVPDWLKD
jgi:hypothetical protein